MPRVRLLLRRRIRPPDHAYRLLGRHGCGLLDVGLVVHRVGLVAPPAALRPGAPLRGPQGRALLPPLRHRAVEPRAGAARRLPGRGGRVGLRPLPSRRLSRCRGSGGGWGRRVVGRVDDHAVDAAVEHGRRGEPRPRLRGRRRGRDGRRSGGRGHGRGRVRSGRRRGSRAPRWSGCATSAPSTTWPCRPGRTGGGWFRRPT